MSALHNVAMEVPPGWTREIPEPGIKDSTSVIYYAPLPHDAKMGVEHRPWAIPSANYNEFLALLEKKPFILTPSQIASIGDVLGNMQWDFKILVCRTMDVDGFRVLFIEGRWDDGTDGQAYIAPGNSSMEDVYEVFYRARRAHYPVLLPAARKAFASINWRVRSRGEVYNVQSRS